jgi:hypothetical protein
MVQDAVAHSVVSGHNGPLLRMLVAWLLLGSPAAGVEIVRVPLIATRDERVGCAGTATTEVAKLI